MRNRAKLLLLIPCLPIGLAIGCGIAEKKPEPYTAPPVIVMAASVPLDTAIEARLLNCVGLLTEFSHAQTMLSISTNTPDQKKQLYEQLAMASAKLVHPNGCAGVLAPVLKVYPSLRETYGDALYFRKHGKLPSSPQSKTPANISRGCFFILSYLPYLSVTE